MLKLRPSVLSATRSRVPSGGRLGVAWLNGALTAVAWERGADGREWVSPETVTEVAAFAAGLREAVASTGFAGTTIALVLSHPRLTQRFVEVPPGRRAIQRRYLQRQAQQQQPDGPVVWASRPTVPTKAAAGVALHLLPRELHDQLVQACMDAGLHLEVLLPLAEALRASVGILNVAQDETTLLAAALPGAIELTVVQGDGTPLLARSVRESWTRDAGRVALELNRTRQFIEQQFARPVTSIWLLGPAAVEQLPALATLLPATVKAAPGEFEGCFWARQAVGYKADHPINLITREQHEARSRRVAQRLCQALAGGLLLAAAVFFCFAENLRRHELAALVGLRHETVALEGRLGELQRRNESVTSQRAVLEALGTNVPMPMWFLGYLSEAVPPSLRLTNVILRTQTNEWWFRIEGGAAAGVVNPDPDGMAGSVRQLSNTLAGGPFGAVFTAGPAETRETASSATWATRLRDRIPGKRAADINFSLEGTLR